MPQVLTEWSALPVAQSPVAQGHQGQQTPVPQARCHPTLCPSQPWPSAAGSI